MLSPYIMLDHFLARIFNHCDPLVPTFYLDASNLTRSAPVQVVMPSKVVMLEMVSSQNRSINLLQSAHGLFPIPNLAIEPLHLVVIHIILKVDVYDIASSRCGLAPKLLKVAIVVKVRSSVRNEHIRLPASDVAGLLNIDLTSSVALFGDTCIAGPVKVTTS
jgi:hypothetical protein